VLNHANIVNKKVPKTVFSCRMVVIYTAIGIIRFCNLSSRRCPLVVKGSPSAKVTETLIIIIKMDLTKVMNFLHKKILKLFVIL